MTAFEKLEAAEAVAWEALLNDPACIANPDAEHTPALKAAWEKACADIRRWSVARSLGIIE